MVRNPASVPKRGYGTEGLQEKSYCDPLPKHRTDLGVLGLPPRALGAFSESFRAHSQLTEASWRQGSLVECTVNIANRTIDLVRVQFGDSGFRKKRDSETGKSMNQRRLGWRAPNNSKFIVQSIYLAYHRRKGRFGIIHSRVQLHVAPERSAQYFQCVHEDPLLATHWLHK